MIRILFFYLYGNIKSAMRNIFISTALLLLTFAAADAQDNKYVAPKEQEVREHIERWQDYKFGMFIHWGAYSQLGIIESWSLVPQPVSWMMKPRKGMPYYEYVKMYEGLKNTFNPVEFDPAKWAAAARYAGMKYMVFTTKHHDGFCMFDTKANDYKITSEECPFHTNPKANIAKEVFDAFRAEGIKPGAYFSIPDWHHDDYWWRFFPPKDTKINYSVKDYPEKWARYQDYIVQQVGELTDGTYGDLEMLWFDLCKPTEDGSAEVPWERIAQTARSNQPGIMTVARDVGNEYENYLTPEQTIPEKALDYPWESCITMTYSWSYRPGLEYKSAKTVLDMLVQIVSRGGNLLLNVGPKPDGTLEDIAYERLEEIGDWMQVNSEGIYGTRPYSTCQDGKICFTKKDDCVYAFYLADEDEEEMPAEMTFKGVTPASSGAVSLLGCRKTLKWEADGTGGIRVRIPESIRKDRPCDHIWCLKIRI